MVTVGHVELAYKEMNDSNIVKVMRTLKKFEILILIALFIENSNIEKVELGRLQSQCENILKQLQEKEQQETTFFKKQLFHLENEQNTEMKDDTKAKD